MDADVLPEQCSPHVIERFSTTAVKVQNHQIRQQFNFDLLKQTIAAQNLLLWLWDHVPMGSKSNPKQPHDAGTGAVMVNSS